MSRATHTSYTSQNTAKTVHREASPSGDALGRIGSKQWRATAVAAAVAAAAVRPVAAVRRRIRRREDRQVLGQVGGVRDITRTVFRVETVKFLKARCARQPLLKNPFHPRPDTLTLDRA